MALTLAFDIYGTLIDTHGVTSTLVEYAGDNAESFSRCWRDKQLEYSFRRGLMQNYVDFSVCTRQALDYTCASYQINLSERDRQILMATYRRLPAFPDVQSGLKQLRDLECRMFGFSNGRRDAVRELLQHAGIEAYFYDIVSVDDLKTYKPAPGVYSHFLRKANAVGTDTWLISSNPFDITGAISAGLHAAWVKRSEQAIFDPWEMQPTIVVESIEELAGGLPI